MNSREQFEEWLTSLPGFEAADIEKREDGKYNYIETEWCWKSWQASRAALPILEQQERGEGKWIEWCGALPDMPAFVDVKYRSGFIDTQRLAGWVDWWDDDIIAYRIIDTNQNGEQ